MHFFLLSMRNLYNYVVKASHMQLIDGAQNSAVSKSRSRNSTLIILGIMVTVEAIQIIKIDKKIIQKE